eukprot:Protomagalhaensia_wolfi_Nauph_80__6235@NODE_940_length_1863_cov_446_209430_g710_i0_p1_GENE_NODE_940_length_1863_cov_446_209430_g710_i0NODE_940_length_1863_cov_446_209430_g710_i0_p1_ORF_typecomplete_len329_score61_65DUF1682/PF07946_14/2_9e42Nup88/PF10168_9/0_027Mit_ribos_Mrp51/PF11709_8/0_061WASH7_C/PF14746_6/5_5e02WASH7_C/PF14746_6/3_1MMR1/PF08505_10/12_NODE_940_length_1863_cov_446_209430_g710_i0521038
MLDELAAAVAGGTLTLAFMLLMFGKYTNQNLAMLWCQPIVTKLDSEFASVDDKIHALSYSEFEVFGSGRKNVKYCLVSLNLVPRQDLFCGHAIPRVLRLLLGTDPTAWGSSTVRDKLVIEIGLRPKDGLSLPTLIIGRKLRAKGLLDEDENPALAAAVQRIESDSVPSWLCLYTHSIPVSNALLKLKPVDTLINIANQAKGTFISLKVSDMIPSARYADTCTQILTLEIALQENSTNGELIQNYLQAALTTADAFATLNLDAECDKQVKKAKEAFIRRQEETAKAEQKKEQQKADQERQQARLAQMTPAEREKYLEKKSKPRRMKAKI